MRVVCQRIVDAHGAPATSSPWLTVGKEYVVLELLVESNGRVHFRLLGDDPEGGPGIWESDLFALSSGTLSSVWTVEIRENGLLRLAPALWHRPGFWEDYFDGNLAAIAAYEAGRDAVLADS